MSIYLEAPVIARCDECRAYSRPMERLEAQAWAVRHQCDEHDLPAFRSEMAALGHRPAVVLEFMDPDDSSGHLECSCGWRSRSAKLCWLGEIGDRHLGEVRAV